MIEKITVRGWQSLVSLDLELARFTVIVGPSSSGKSALMRALRAVASNVSGTDKITRGHKNAAITVTTADATVTLEFGKFSNDTVAGWYYRLLPRGGKEQIFTKLNRSVPADVTAALRIDPVPTKGASINFAGQHDGPFLLQDSGANVARVLGELTGVDRIFEAAREAVRRRNGLSSTLKTREADLAELSAQAATFADLPARLKALSAAEEAAERAARLTDRITRLEAARDQLDVAQAVLERSSVLPAVPSLDLLDAAQAKLDAYKNLVRLWADRRHSAGQWQAEAGQLADSERGLEQELQVVLDKACVCPTCQRAM